MHHLSMRRDMIRLLLRQQRLRACHPQVIHGKVNIWLSLTDVLCWRRQEWELQKPIRSGTPRRVVDVASRNPNAVRWATVASQGPCSSFYLSSQKKGSILLLNTDAAGAEPVTLGLGVRGAYKAFVRRDGLLCIVSAATHRPAPYRLTWHTIHPASGQVLSSEHKHFWTVHPDLLDWVFHAASHKVVAMPDEQSVVLMEADTLLEISRFRVPDGNPEAGTPALSLGSLAWSHDGARLAITCALAHGKHRFPFQGFHEEFAHKNFRSSTSSEVHIYGVVSAQHQQNLVLQGSEPQISWSSSLEILLVSCYMEHCPDHVSVGGTLRTMHPAEQKVVLIHTQNDPNGLLWEACTWSPCGSLLLTNFIEVWGPGDGFATRIQDPHSLKCIMDTPPHADYPTLAWGCRACTDGKGSHLTAYVAEQGFVAELWQANGEWQAQLRHLEGLENCREGSIMPSGTALVGLRKQRTESKDLFHYDLGTKQESVIARGLHDHKHADDDPSCLIAWAPIAIAWQQIYAYVHKEGLAAPDSVRLVDANAHKVLGSWTSASLKSQGARRLQRRAQQPDDVSRVIWSPNGRHLAIQCSFARVLIILF